MDVAELYEYFKNKELPQTFQFDKAVRILDVPKFVDSHFTVIKHNGNTPAFSSYLLRLNVLREMLEAENV
ncbi:MAG TPA: hypothetical protein VGD90_08865 [Sphingobacteriaceae bacterium]